MKSVLALLFIASMANAETTLSLATTRQIPIPSLPASAVIENGKLVSSSCDALSAEGQKYRLLINNSGDYECVPAQTSRTETSTSIIDVGVEMSVSGIQSFFINSIQQTPDLSRGFVISSQPVCALTNGALDVNSCKCQSDYLAFNTDTKTCEFKSNMIFIPYATCGGGGRDRETIFEYVAKQVYSGGVGMTMCTLDIARREVLPHPLVFKILFFLGTRHSLAKSAGVHKAEDVYLQITKQEVDDLETWLGTQQPNALFQGDVTKGRSLVKELREKPLSYNFRSFLVVE